MPALTTDRNTAEFQNDLREGPVAASQLIYAGAIVCRNAAGDLVKGITATGLTGVGVARERVDNSAGAAGAKTIRYKVGVFRFGNSASGDLITKADIGKAAWVVDDQTVAKTSASNTRSKAGVIEAVDDLGVMVRFDEALARVAS
jgi:hypothetical protein